MKTFLPALLVVCLLTGCASHYTLTLNNGNRITAKSKPKLKNGFYVFEDVQGKPAAVAAGRVKEISPANMTSSRTSSGYSATPIK
jgi:hypothetical protein